VKNAGLIVVYYSLTPVAQLEGDLSSLRLGEYVFLSTDSVQSQQLIVAASVFATEDSRYINLYKILSGGKLLLW